ncbi:MAG: ORF6N domain-containing protein [Campylobacterales bacterium]|nr:ORF6N domain-containing protein [Campylobacterales bacterium]
MGETQNSVNSLHVTHIREKIYVLRGVEVMLDSDLAELYEVDTKRINEAVRRNPEKFPDDFMFECSEEEWEILRSQNATSSWGGRRHAPKAFAEQGVYMLATVLKSQRATDVTISIMRTFTRLRHYALQHTDLAGQIQELKHEVAQNRQWTKERMGAIADAIIMLEESFDELKEVVSEIGAAKEVEAIGFLRGSKND